MQPKKKKQPPPVRRFDAVLKIISKNNISCTGLKIINRKPEMKLGTKLMHWLLLSEEAFEKIISRWG